MQLRGKIKITGIRRKSKAAFFENIEVGDVIAFKQELRQWRDAATRLTATNERTGEVREEVSIRNLSNILDAFDFEELS